MKRKVWVVALIAALALPIALWGCKSKVEKMEDEEMQIEEQQIEMPVDAAGNAGAVVTTPFEPSQTVAAEAVPATAAVPGQVTAPAPVSTEKQDRNKDIQRALKNAGFYSGAIDGKIGPKTKKAIEAFQTANNLKADGKVGPKTWAALEKHLVQ